MKKILALVLVAVLSFGALSVFAAVEKYTGTADAPAGLSFTQSEVKLASNGKRYVDLTFDADLTGYTLSAYSGSDLNSIKFRSSINSVRLGTSDYTGSVSTSDTDKGKATNKLTFNTATQALVAAAGGNREGYFVPDNVVRVYWNAYKGTSYGTDTVKLKASVTIKLGSTKSDKWDIEATYSPEDLLLELVGDNQASFTAVNGKIYKMEEAGSLSEVQFEGESGRVIELSTGRLPKNTKFNLTSTTTIPSGLEDQYSDKVLEYFAITGTTSSLGSWKLTFDSIDAATYVYAYEGGALTNLADGSWGWKRTGSIITVTGSGSIPALVLSSTDLKIQSTTTTTSSAPTTTTTTNPNTGSSDMVSVAVVMAVVSLGAAGAVAFKKASK